MLPAPCHALPCPALPRAGPDPVCLLRQGSGYMQGGAFDLSSHPAIQRYMESPHLTYRPLLFIPNGDTDKSMVQ